MPRASHLIPALVQFTGEEVIRNRFKFFALLLSLIAIIEVLLAVRGSASRIEGLGIFFIVGLWVVAGPLCGSWVDEDVRLGYGALWLQKPLKPFDFYLARLVSLVVWANASATAVCLSALPGFAVAGDVQGLAELTLGAGWIPTLLVVLSFLGSSLGARNGGLFAYAMLFAGFALPGFADAAWLGLGRDVLEIIFPPASAGLAAVTTIRSYGVAAAVAQLLPIVLYTIACAMLGLLLALGVPSRLMRAL